MQHLYKKIAIVWAENVGIMVVAKNSKIVL